MQWLNKVDDALDRVFLRSAGGADTTEAGGDDGDNSHGRCENQSSVNSVRVTGMERDHNVIHSVGGVNRDVGTAPSSRTGIDSGLGKIVPRPPPPPPPPPPLHSKSIPPPPKRSISSISFPSTPIAAAAAGEFLIDDGALIASDDNPTEGVSLDFEGGSTSEERLRNLASVMQQLERDAMESGPDDNYQFHGRYEMNESEGGESVNRASDNQTMQSIPLLPLSSQMTRDTDSQSQRINLQHHGNPNSQNQKSTKSNFIVHLPASSCHKPPPPPPPLQPAQSSHRFPPASNPNNHQWAPSTPRLPLHSHHPMPTPRITPSRNTPRPTPGIIRRKIRSPSVSPPNSSTSPLPSFDEIDDRNNGATMLPPPPFIDGDNTIESLSKAAITAAATASGMQQSPELMTPIPTVNAVTRNVMVHRSPRKVNPFSDESTEESNILEKKDQVTNIDPAKNTLRAWTGDDEAEKAKDERISKNERIADDDSSSTSFHSHISNRSDLTDDDNEDDDRTEQEVLDFALPEKILESPSSKSWDPAYNCYGVVHVRVLRAQRLPCTVGTFVVANLSLPPWKGRVRIPGRATIDGPEGAGVCLRWDKPFSKREKDRGSVDGMTDDPCSHSMVHAYNNKDTPIPIVSLTLLSSTMGGVFEKFLCSASFSCRDIMKSPGIWSSKWCNATIDPVLGSASTSSSQQQSLLHGVIHESTIEEAESDEKNPLILLEACFEPKHESEQIISEDSDTLGPIPRDLVIRSSPENRLRAMPENVYSSMEDDSISKTSTLTSALVRHQTPKSHLLRVRSFWSPAWCSVCSKIITSGWVQSSFECEACHIFCCKDCQLQVDVCIPCGSELSKIAVKKAQQYQVSIGQVMTTLAPYSGRGTSGEQNLSNVEGRAPTTVSKIEGIGVLRIRVLNACLFGKTYPPDAEPTDIFAVDSTNLRNGDHYVRISWLGSKDSKRTKTVLQAAKPVFDSDEMMFDVAHYGMEYKLEVVDANTDKAVGSCLLSAQGLLQWQRDDLLAHWDQFFFTLLQRRRQAEPRKMKLELRTAAKDGFGLNFYNSTKIADDSKEKSSSFVPGEISGWVEIDVDFEEDTQGLFYSRDPRPCPPRATEEFDIAMIQLHIARIAAIAEDIQKLVTAYLYLVSWENPLLTGSSLIVFVALTLGYNLEYLGALPIGILVMYMVYLGQIRLTGKFKERWIKKEKDALVESESTIEKHYTIHRPVGLLHVADLRGRNLRSRDLGLPGSFYVSISFDPLRYASDKEKKSFSRLDAASSCTHHVGTTISPGITSSPIWSRIRESAELSRLKHLLPDDRLWSEDLGTDSEGLVKYPILQPITKDRSLYLDENEDDRRSMDIGLLPWESSLGALVLQVRFSEVLGSFQLFENVLGEVVLPLAKLAGGQEVEGWFRLLGAGTTDTVPGTSDDDPIAETKPRGLSEDGESIPDEHDTDVPELHAKVKFLTHSIQPSSDTETSRVICEEMSRTASVSREGSIGMIGSSISTINTVRTLGGTLQNQLSYTVNIIEMIRNAFNFSVSLSFVSLLHIYTSENLCSFVSI
eukprot:CCRYP_008976-RA/>CCRYP_008976-RA protein AED:0.07 eAED:0.07 QI:1632/1/1/1/1/0.75/4/1949/1546